MEKLAEALKVPQELQLAFFELYETQGEANARRWKSKKLDRVRSAAEVNQCIDALPDLLDFIPEDDERSRAHACDRLLFCGRYSAKEGTPLDDALEAASQGLRLAAETSRIVGAGKLGAVIRKGTFGDEHLACRGRGFPYRPSVAASHGSPIIEARAADETPAARKGTLLGYVAVQGDYIDDLAVEPPYMGQGIAAALLVAVAELSLTTGRGRGRLSLDVRAANTPAVALYRKLGFEFGPNVYPGFLDWDGGFEGEADAKVVRERLPQNAVLEL